MKIPGIRAGFLFAVPLGVVIEIALAIPFLPRDGGGAAGDESDISDATLRKRSQERLGPWIERMRARYSESFAVGRDYYERTIEEAQRGLANHPRCRSSEYIVVTMAQYANMSDSAAWGVSGFHPDYIGPADNDNQIEHLAISAVTQRVFHVPVIALSAVEYAQWRLERSVDEGEARADSALNAAVASDFVPYYAVDNPAHACERLALALSQPASKP